MSAGGIPSEQAAVILEKVRSDRSLPVTIRSRAWKAASDVSQPARALRRLQTLAGKTLPGVARDAPSTSLSRVVSAGTFWRHHTSLEWRDMFTTVDDFVRFINSSSDPNTALTDMLSRDPIAFPWQRSWLAQTRQIRGLDGRSLVKALELGSAVELPLVAFHLPLDLLLGSGVMVRRPCSLDSVLGPNPQWSPSGLASGIEEYIDGDVPLSAIGTIEWVR
jgi:hypothetical protein